MLLTTLVVNTNIKIFWFFYFLSTISIIYQGDMLHLQYAVLVKNNFKLVEKLAPLVFKEFKENIFWICPRRPAISEKMLQEVMSQRQAPQPNFNFQPSSGKSS